MEKYVPKMYQKSVLDIDYDKLKEIGIKCLLFDLDNTLVPLNVKEPNDKLKEFIDGLKKDFKIIILSNNNNIKKLSITSTALDIDFVKFALKPFNKGFKMVEDKYNFDKKEMCIIGDQIMTDVLGGNKYGIYTVLIDPLKDEDLKVTLINRMIEKKIFKKLSKKKLFNKGDYYG